MENKAKPSGSRKRGRPAGKHRKPLTLEERRARNAQYERERRVEMSEAFADLTAAAGCDASISHSELLATVVTQLQRGSEVDHSTEMESLKRTNAYYLAQIADLEQRLAEPEDGSPLSPAKAAKRKRTDSEEKKEETLFQEPTESSDELSPETGKFDYSQYSFASAEIHTPEYRIASATDCIPAGSPSPQDPAFYEDTGLPQQGSSTFSPSQFVVPEAQYEEVVLASSPSTLNYPDQYWVQQPVHEVPVMQCTIELPVQQNDFDSLEILSEPEDDVLPSVAGGEFGVGEPNVNINDMIVQYHVQK